MEGIYMDFKTCFLQPLTEKTPLRRARGDSKQGSKSLFNCHLTRGLKFSLTVFPKPTAFIKPPKSPFHNPTFGENYELMQFTAFDDLDVCTNDFFDTLRKGLAHISTITKDSNNMG